MLLDNLEFVTGLHIEPVLAGVRRALQSKLLALYGGADDAAPLGDLAAMLDEPDAADTVEVVTMTTPRLRLALRCSPPRANR